MSLNEEPEVCPDCGGAIWPDCAEPDICAGHGLLEQMLAEDDLEAFRALSPSQGWCETCMPIFIEIFYSKPWACQCP